MLFIVFMKLTCFTMYVYISVYLYTTMCMCMCMCIITFSSRFSQYDPKIEFMLACFLGLFIACLKDSQYLWACLRF